MAKIKAEASIFEVPSEGIHPAVVVAVIDLGTHMRDRDEKKDGKATGNKVQKPTVEVFIGFELAERKSDGTPFIVGQPFTLSLAPLATLPKLYKACGLAVPEPGEESIVQEVFAGKRLGLNLSHKQSKDKQGKDRTFVKIEAFLPADKRDEPFEPAFPPVYWELGDELVEDTFAGLPRIFGQRIEDVIADSVEMQKQLAGAAS